MLNDILTRLAAMHTDEGSATVFKLPPPVVRRTEIPLLYAVPTGFSEVQTSQSTIERAYTFVIEVLVLDIDTDNLTAASLSQGVVSTTTIMESMTTYYNAHRLLTTSSLGILDNVNFGMTIDAEGVVVPLVGHDGNPYIGTRFNLTVNTRIAVSLTP